MICIGPSNCPPCHDPTAGRFTVSKELHCFFRAHWLPGPNGNGNAMREKKEKKRANTGAKTQLLISSCGIPVSFFSLIL